VADEVIKATISGRKCSIFKPTIFMHFQVAADTE